MNETPRIKVRPHESADGRMVVEARGEWLVASVNPRGDSTFVTLVPAAPEVDTKD